VFGVVLGVATLLSRLHTRGTVQSLQEFTAVRVLEDASGWIRAAAWSQNLLATAGDDKTVRIYDFDQDREREARLWVR
jgi:WD40 repeat protein